MFFALSAIAATFLYSTKWAYGWIADLYPLLIDGGPKDGYTGDYICSMAQVTSKGSVKFLAYDSVGEKLLDETMQIK